MSQAFIANELKARLLEHAPNRILPAKRLEVLQANLHEKYPDAKFDCIIAPLVLISQEARLTFFKEIHRILAPQGFFLFSTLGHAAPHELEMLGDALLKTGFQLPVVDKETLQLQYDDMSVLLKDLEQSGLNEQYARVTKESPTDITATFEVMYGYALGAAIEKKSSGKIEIPLATLKIRRAE